MSPPAPAHVAVGNLIVVTESLAKLLAEESNRNKAALLLVADPDVDEKLDDRKMMALVECLLAERAA